MSFLVTSFPVQKRERAHNACLSCRSRKRRCEIRSGEKSCIRCQTSKLKCQWDKVSHRSSLPKSYGESDEDIFVKMFRDRDQRKPQFVCATQPLASLLSKDSVLCFDGDAYGLYYPWRGERRTSSQIGNNLRKYLEAENAFVLPSIVEQRKLIHIFFDHLYPFYPVVDQDFRTNFTQSPLILLNAVFLAATRFDKTIPRKNLRERLAVLYERCKLLEMVETNKVVLIQAYLLLSIHEEGMEGVTSSKEYVAKACNLCGELAITNMGYSDEASQFPLPKESSTFPRALLRRLLWTTFCCDRLVSATSGREMIFNMKDFYIEPFSERDFEDDPNSSDNVILFSSWLHLNTLTDRIQCALYRPPASRTIDANLQKDIESWIPPEINDPEKVGFLKVTHAYLCLLYLRRGIDSVALSLHNTSLLATFDKQIEITIQQIHRTSSDVLEYLESPRILHHIVVVHAVLHVVALLQLELSTHYGIEVQKQEFKNYYNKTSKRCIGRLEEFKDYWWFAGSALKLCHVITKNEIT
ncbi:hypothetical protein ACI3LY_001542 [Candidozyma auris]|uniref:Zn(2)-C6 fungal-type domain-containing protein n=2 Tax=Candidozyma auris TaxID=498019 RepID=A0A2H1A0P4_CANAR|nr:hypothetical protein B9J08_001620 [[Candida] auris]PIS56438.1 hypothetical protein CJI97_001690 [[Candida] auris]